MFWDLARLLKMYRVNYNYSSYFKGSCLKHTTNCTDIYTQPPIFYVSHMSSLSMEMMSKLKREETMPNPSRETKFSGANGYGEILFFPVQLTTSRIGNLTRLIHTLAKCVIIHTYGTYYIPTVSGRRKRKSHRKKVHGET